MLGKKVVNFILKTELCVEVGLQPLTKLRVLTRVPEEVNGRKCSQLMWLQAVGAELESFLFVSCRCDAEVQSIVCL